MFVIGTAGHVDHGKSALVRALSGIDPDRWEEEKARGLTIDLGFAWTTLPSGREVSIVDVPGHERFIKNMLAGVGGINLALLVVAADEGVMPQTREHLDILDLLDLREGVVALTKSDLVDEEWLELVADEVRELLAETSLADAPIVPCSALSGDGLDPLRETLDAAVASLGEVRNIDRPRLPIDRAFSISGFGTVVTGTLIDGPLRVGDSVVVEPAGLSGRIRGLQSHEQSIETAEPGARTAANLGGIGAAELRRGMVLTAPGWLHPAQAVDVRLRVVKRLPRALRHNTTLTLHVGAAEVEARVRLLEGDALEPGGRSWAQLRLAEPIAAARGDHFVLRSGDATLAGGRIVDTRPRRHHRNDASTLEALQRLLDGSPDDTLLTMLQRHEPIAWAALRDRLQLADADAQAALRRQLEAGAVVALDDGESTDSTTLASDAGYAALQQRSRRIAAEFVERQPLSGGIPREDLRSRLGLPPRAFAVLERQLLQTETLAAADGLLDLPGRTPDLSDDAQAQIESLLARLREQGVRPDVAPDIDPSLLQYLEARGEIVRLNQGVLLLRGVYDEMVAQTRALLAETERATLAEIRDQIGTSRKIAQSFLEETDRRRITRRIGDHRILRDG